MSLADLRPIAAADWNLATAKHLLNRAGFGAPFSLVEKLARMTPTEAVSYLVDYDAIYDPLHGPDFLVEPLSPEEVDVITSGMSDSKLGTLSNAGDAFERENLGLLQGWWLDRMMRTTRPLEEKLTLFWHGHFATSAQKVRESWRNHELNRLLRAHATGNVKDLCVAVGRSPAMLKYLDNTQNRKGGPNENWARELLELFTMGHGNYTEDDIKNAARGFTGWTTDHKQYVFDPRAHDFGPKRFLGRTGDFNGREIIEIIFDTPAPATFICGKLWTYFVSDDPRDEVIAALADTMRAQDYELRPVLTQLFSSRAFYDARVMGTQIKSPVQLAIQLCHDLDFEVPPYHGMVDATESLGQRLFYPPNVAGWPGGHTWINANTLTARYNLPVALVSLTMSEDDGPFGERMGSGMMMADGQMDPAVDIGGSMGRLLDAVPRGRREEVAARLGFDSPKYRRWLRTYATRWRNRARWNSGKIFAKLQFGTAGECVDALERRFLSGPLDPAQRRLLIEALGKSSETTPLHPGRIPDERMNQTLHLLFSLAEYQLC